MFEFRHWFTIGMTAVHNVPQTDFAGQQRSADRRPPGPSFARPRSSSARPVDRPPRTRVVRASTHDSIPVLASRPHVAHAFPTVGRVALDLPNLDLPNLDLPNLDLPALAHDPGGGGALLANRSRPCRG